ncbi:hypothetical protein lerEdw1_005479 [Lerista edwardsae]|nr:hypothetical protein lerEdw1_005479 [Lerista edwardsae]
MCSFLFPTLYTAQILSRCDISVLQEVMDVKGKAIPALLAAMNRFDGTGPYRSLTSPRMGRGNYQESYVFIYREQSTQILDSYKYEDNHPNRPDVFAREPFIVRISTPNKVKLQPLSFYAPFLSILLHQQDSSFAFKQDMIFLGDFNADCGYVAKKRWGQIRLRQKPGFHWLISDKADTTVRETTHCAYDRIVVHGERCLAAVVPESAQPFDFPQKFGLSEAEALEISDHYPVELELNAAPWGFQQANLTGLLQLILAMLSGSGYYV